MKTDIGGEIDHANDRHVASAAAAGAGTGGQGAGAWAKAKGRGRPGRVRGAGGTGDHVALAEDEVVVPHRVLARLRRTGPVNGPRCRFRGCEGPSGSRDAGGAPAGGSSTWRARGRGVRRRCGGARG